MRDNFVDIAKSIAIIAVVRIHTECMGYMHIPYPVIAVPLFFFLSGFYDRSEKSIREWGIKAFYSLIVTAAIWSTITWGFHTISNSLKDHFFSLDSIPFSIYKPFIGNGVTWFLVALFNAKILLWIIINICNHATKNKKRQTIMAGTLSICLGTFSSIFNLPCLLDEGMAALPFYFAGKIFYPHIKDIIRNKSLIIIGLFILCLMPCRWFPYVLIVMGNHPFFLYIPFYIAILLSFVPVLSLCTFLGRHTWLAKVGRESLGIMVIHPILLHSSAVVLNRLLDKGSTLWCACFSVAFIFVCILSYLLSKYIRKHYPILLGTRK